MSIFQSYFFLVHFSFLVSIFPKKRSLVWNKYVYNFVVCEHLSVNILDAQRIVKMFPCYVCKTRQQNIRLMYEAKRILIETLASC